MNQRHAETSRPDLFAGSALSTAEHTGPVPKGVGPAWEVGMNYNKVILAGHLTRDPQLKHLPSQLCVADFGIAINRKWKSPAGESREEVAFVDCVAFGKTAEVINQHLAKGRAILIEGRLKFDQWEGKDGAKRSKITVVVESFQFMNDRGSDAHQGGNSPRQPQPDAIGNQSHFSPDDIPF
jgi:single-strand DNA-binding protein